MNNADFKESLVLENEITESNTNSEIKQANVEKKGSIKRNSTKLFFIDESTTIESDYENFIKIYYDQLAEVEVFYQYKLSELIKDFTKLSKKMCNKKSTVNIFNIGDC